MCRADRTGKPDTVDLQSEPKRRGGYLEMIGLLFIAVLLVFDAFVYRRIGSPYR
jgi:hypothetical protein